MSYCDSLYNEFHLPDRIPNCYVDDSLNPSDAKAIDEVFRRREEMLLLKDQREQAYNNAYGSSLSNPDSKSKQQGHKE